MEWSWALAAVAALAAVLALCLGLTARREQRRWMARLRHDAERQDRAMASLNQAVTEATRRVGESVERQNRLRDAMDARLDALQSASDRRMEQMRASVSEKLDGRLSEVNRQLNDVHQGLGEMRELAGGFADLRRILGGVKTRGSWGEVQLRALLEQILAPSQYVENAAIPEGSSTRVEFAVRLPASDGEALLPIDSKFPQEDFLRLTEAANDGDAARAEACAAALERALIEQAKAISSKYVRPPQTADFAVLFLPVESLYAEAVRRPGLCERLQTRYRVLVAGPNTLAALLTSLRLGFRTVTLERRSGEALRLLAEVREEFSRYEEASGQVRRRLAQTAEAMDALDARARRLSRRLKNVSEDEPD